MSRKFDSALDDCLDLLRAGASISDCLARYPEHAEELRPFLTFASDVKAIPTPRPDPAAVDASRQRMLDAAQAAAARRQQGELAPFSWIWRRSAHRQIGPLWRAVSTMAAMVVIVSLAAIALFASAADSLPGQALYPVKRFGEDARLSLTLSSARRQELQSEYLMERRLEVRQVLDAGHQTVLEFRGELEEIGDDYWVVGGLKVMLNGDTLVEGHVAAGAMVIVRGSTSSDGTLRALKLQVLTNPLLLTPASTSTPTPTVTAPPTSTPTPTATLTAVPSSTPAPTLTVTSTPSTTPTPAPTMTPIPVPTITPTPAPTRTEEPEPTDTPEEYETEEPEHTDDPDPTHTEEPESQD